MWEITVLTKDETGEIVIVFLDREIRTVFDLTVRGFDEEVRERIKL